MARKRKPTGMEKCRQILIREAKALFAGVSTFAGAATFFLIVDRSWGIVPADWWQMALAATLMCLPKVYAKLHESDEPYVILFALAFREGFLYLTFIAPDLSKWVTKMRGLWKDINRK